MKKKPVLRPASDATINEFHKMGAAVAAAASDRFKEIETTTSMPDEAHHQMVVEGLEMTTRMVESFLAVASEELIRDQLRWSAGRLPHEGLPPASIVAGLRVYKGVLSDTLSKGAAEEIVPYFDFMIDELSIMARGENGDG